MPYVRRRGSHLAIVHGARHPETKQVEQEVLMTLHSKAEALAALGKTSDANAQPMFRRWMERRHPDVRFAWTELDRRLEEMKDELPDLAPSRQDRALGGFRETLLAFARHIMNADPQTLDSARELFDANRVELEWLTDLIDRRLESAERSEPSEWSQDPFGWRLVLGDYDVDPQVEEEVAGLYERGELDRAERIFNLLVDAYPKYAEGHNYLGLIELERGNLKNALARFETTAKIGRTLFPKRIAKRDYWNRLETRPYMRGLRNQWVVLHRLGRYAKALDVAERLDRECGDDITAAVYRAATYLGTGEWGLAYGAALFVAVIFPSESLIVALAAFELGERDVARVRFVHAMLNAPRTVAIALGKRMPVPRNWVEARDHNAGVVMREQLCGYLDKRSRGAKQFFDALWKDAEFEKLRDEIVDTECQKDALDRADEASYMKLFRRLDEMRSWEFAEAVGEAGPRSAKDGRRRQARRGA
jgi:tetratricopeptide (TPR) repeat protein